ncbi:hypothetical protein G4B88_003799 [Cannabis sativa]|uniref:Uncharacterized protein n=1 Tax=Cannabis sativa TaxID=3483 RepID=A0A7J6FN95_CANSA|nr:hypothetical protein G4B88_003799 [Cannabis sativa]
MANQEEGIDDYTEDGTVDLKGNPILRSKRGGWKACSFVVVTASNNVTNWIGAIWLTPILGAYIADAHLGRYPTFIISSSIYFTKASTLQLAVFYGALYTLALGTGGTKPNISTIGADQFDDFHPKEKKQKLSFFNWWMFSIFFGTFFANTVLVWLQDNIGWTLGYALPTLGLAISIGIFLSGTPFYRHKVPTGSPFVKMAQVIIAAMRKWKVPIPHDLNELYELDLEVYEKKGKYRIDPTPSLSVVLYDWYFVKIIQKWTKNPRGITLLQRMGIGMIFHIILMSTASLIERHRLSVAREYGVVENGGQVPLSIFILLPQFVLMGIADAFLEVAKIEFFYDQAPENMKSLGTSYAMTTLGVGSFLSSFLLSTVSNITKRNGHHGWILNNLNDSHLDYYYAFFAMLSFDYIMGNEEEGIDDYTEDGSVDLKGNPVRRSKRGGWRACAFVVVYEVFERMAYYGIQSNLIIYLSKKLHQGTVTASNNVTNWVGTVTLTPVLGAYIADAHLGRSILDFYYCIYHLSWVSIPMLKPPTCLDSNPNNCKKPSTLQVAVFFGALYTLALGTGGTKPNISTIGADQFDDFEPKEKKQKISFFN